MRQVYIENRFHTAAFLSGWSQFFTSNKCWGGGMVHTPEATVLAPIIDLGKAGLQVRILPTAQIGLTLIFVKMVSVVTQW